MLPKKEQQQRRNFLNYKPRQCVEEKTGEKKLKVILIYLGNNPKNSDRQSEKTIQIYM